MTGHATNCIPSHMHWTILMQSNIGSELLQPNSEVVVPQIQTYSIPIHFHQKNGVQYQTQNAKLQESPQMRIHFAFIVWATTTCFHGVNVLTEFRETDNASAATYLCSNHRCHFSIQHFKLTPKIQVNTSSKPSHDWVLSSSIWRCWQCKNQWSHFD